MSILVNVVCQKMYVSSTADELVAGSQQFVKFKFNLSSEWDGLMTFAQFRQGANAYNLYLDEDNSVCLPPEIGVGTCTMMLYGSHNTTIGTTNYLTFKIGPNNLVSDAESTDISQSLYDQLVTKINALTSWNGQSVADLESSVQDLRAQMNRKATQADLISEIARAKTAENANASAILLKADQSQVDELELKVTELANNEVIVNLIDSAVEKEMAEYLASGVMANMTIQDGSITRAKMDSSVSDSLARADDSMQPAVYDPQNLKVDIYSYAQGRADIVANEVNTVRQEIADAYTLTDTLKYQKLGDALRGAVTLSRSYAQALLADYKAFTIEIVDELPTAGNAQTFYLVPKDSGGGYDKYWYITDAGGNSVWDVFGGSSTEVVEELPEVGEADVDYILHSDSGYLYYKYIDGFWQIVAGSMAYISTSLPDVSTGSEYTDYYIVNQSSGTYTHYRFINGAFHVIGGDSYTKDEINERISALSDAQNATNQRVEANETNISSLSGTMTKLQQDFNNLDVEGYTYYATYGTTTMIATGEVKDYVFTMFQCKDGVEEVISQFVIAGGGGGTGDIVTTNLVVERITSSPIVVTPTDDVWIEYSYSSTDSDGEEIDGTYTWKIGGAIVASGSCIQGVNRFNATDFVSVGTHKLTLTVVDEGGSAVVKSWTVQVVDVRMESAFSDKITYTANREVNFTYTPYGATQKTVHFILDGEELEPVITTASGTLQSYTLPAQPHGAHLLECYITATVNSLPIETEHIYKDIVWYDDTSTTPVISCVYRNDHYGKKTARQYDTTNITYHVFDPATNVPSVTHTADGTVISTQTLSAPTNTWSYKSDTVGDHVLVISCKDTAVTVIMDIQELGIEIAPVTANLAFDFNPIGLSNKSENRLWKDAKTGVSMSVSSNFDWTNGGYQLDANGNQYFCVKAGTTATINHKLFGSDKISSTGAEFKVIFNVENVKDVDTTFLSCVSGDTSVGLRMDAHAAYLMTSATGSEPLYMPYSETDIIEYEININPIDTEDTNATALIMSYEDGTGYRPLLYDASHRLYQYTYEAEPITIGSPDCDVHIYRMKAYNSFLSDTDILSNFIADASDSETMLDRYDRNQIYNENNALTPESVAKACPDLKIIKIDAPYFTQDKNEMIKNTTVQCIHTNGDKALDNWTARNCYHSGQGTTSNEYGYAGRNLNVYMCFDGRYKHKRVNGGVADPTYITELTMGDGTKYSDGTGKVTLTRTSVPNALFNIKVNIASSENANNAILAQRYHRYLPYTPVSAKRDPYAKTTMEFVNCVVFIRENDPDVSTHREFQDTDWHFYAIGNIGDSKDTDQTRTNDPDDHNEFVIEISDNTKPNSIFPTGVVGSDGRQVYPISASQWKAGNPAYDDLHNNWDETFEFRYSHPDVTDEEEAAHVQIWNDMYKWMITSSDEEFVSELGNWFIEDAALYMYLFTERYTMLDNRAKNTFWHWGKVYITSAEAASMGEEKASWFTIDNAKAAINNGYRFDFWDYDNDTSLGINNSGEMTQPYGKEDVDFRIDGDPNSGYIFNAAESTFFRRIRKLMPTKLSAMYLSRETANAWSATGLITEFDNWQNQFCEELWRLDTERKYYRTYYGGTKRFLETMMNGRKRYHRRQWERDQEAYMGTKYVSANIKRDQIMFRCNTPLEAVVEPNYDLSIVPYSDMYLSVLYGNSSSPMQIRAKAGQTYTIENPLGNTMDDTAILIYCASRIQALNDLSGCYIHDNDFSKASKLQTLTIGNSTEGYANTFLTELNIGNNVLLQELNVRNCPNLIGSVNLTNCGNLETFYAEGTAITGVTFAPNGKIVSAYLPDTINTMSMKNLGYLTDLRMSYDRLESLTEENTVVDELAIVQDAIDTLQTLHLSGINWTIPDTTLLNEILKMNSSMLSGVVNVSGAIRHQELMSYKKAWPDLIVNYNAQNLVTQYIATYVNADAENTVLYEVYIDRGLTPPDPYAEGWIEKPILEPDAQYTYEFGSTSPSGEYIAGSGWNELTGEMLASRTIVAVYTTTVRTYTVRWYSRPGLPLGSVTAEYGSEIVYPGELPTNESEESAYIYNAFAGWDKSTGFIKEDLDVYAIWDRAPLPSTGKDLKDMTPGEIFAVAKSGRAANYFELKDYVDIKLGHDFEFANVDSEVLAEDQWFDGKTAIDTDITLFGENDRSFTMAIDFQFSDTSANNTLIACYAEDGQEGFRLRYNNYPNIQWGDMSQNFGCPGCRDIVVLRHRKGDSKLYIYASSKQNDKKYFDADITRVELTRSRNTHTNALLTLGAIRFAADGGHDDYGTGYLHWCKVWHEDLGETNARQLATWCRETIRMEFYGSERYRLADGTSKRSNASFICNHCFANRSARISPTNTNIGGWDGSELRAFMNDRVKRAFPTVWQSMLQKVKINASAGGESTQIIISEDYLYAPSVTEMTNISTEPYVSEGQFIPWYTDSASRGKFNGLIIQPDSTYYRTGSTDPSTDSTNVIKEGDIWRNNAGGLYIYTSQEYLDRHMLTPSKTAHIGGGWVSANFYATRSADINSSTNSMFISSSGVDYSYASNSYQYVCPCFSI